MNQKTTQDEHEFSGASEVRMRFDVPALEAYMATYASHVKAGEPVMQGAPVALASMLENGRGGPKDLARAVQIYTAAVRQSHLTCEPEAVDALKRLNKPVPEGTGPACEAKKPVNPLEQ